MATMSTSSHSLSVLTSHSVKLPVDPKTGLKITADKRPQPTHTHHGFGWHEDNDLRMLQSERAGRMEKMLSKLATVDPANLEFLRKAGENPDENFYQKLLELKNEQRQILQKCERVYLEKHNGTSRPEQMFSAYDKSPQQTSRTNDHTVASKTFIEKDGILTAVQNKDVLRPCSPEAFDEEEVLLSRTSSRPPTGRPPIPQESKSPSSRPRSAPLPREIARSLDELRQSVDEFRKSFDYSDDEYVPDDTVSEPYTKKDESLAQKMWQNFSIDDYAPRRSLERPASATLPRKEKSKDESWRHRLTIPKPFTMTIRDESKGRKKSKTIMEFEEKMNQKEIEEEEEMKKKFKARPVPAHVYLPLYDEIKEKSEERRRHVRHASIELLKSQEKPFSFLKREEDKKQHVDMERDCNKPVKVEVKQTFKAKPVPKSIFDQAVDDKLMEEEEYRKIRMKMRAEEMLRDASLPPNMKAREQLKEQMERQQKIKNKRKGTKGASRPKVNHDVPNYDALYRHFQQELQHRKGMKEATISRPFHLETERTSKTARDKIKKQIEQEERAKKENRWPYTMSSTRVKLGTVFIYMYIVTTKLFFLSLDMALTYIRISYVNTVF